MIPANRAVRIRPALIDDALGIARVNVRSWQGAYRGILPDSFLDALDASTREERLKDALRQQPGEGRFTLVAELSPAADGQSAEIIGFSSGGPEREGLVLGEVAFDGEIYALYLAPEHQRQGNGRRLIAASTELLVERGMRSVVIWALKGNLPARAFYEKMGGVLAGEKHVTIGPSDLLDIAYGWPDAHVLLARAQGASG